MNWIAVTLIIRWLLGWTLVLRSPETPKGVPRQQQKIIVLIPARNEARTLPKLLINLKRQKRQPDEIIIINDNSSDRTEDIAKEYSQHLPLRVITPPPPPTNWCGKNWALHHGVLESAGKSSKRDDVLVFLDADTEPAPEFLLHLICAREQLGGLVSVQPYHRTEKPYEQLSMLFNLVGLMAVPLGPKSGVAFGPAMATSRCDYEKSGGHKAVANKVVEDWFLAHCYERAGLTVSAFIGNQEISYRMYPGGIGDMINGFNKNFATAAGEVHWKWMVAVLLWLSGLFWAAWCLPAAVFGWPLVGTTELKTNLVIYCGYAIQLSFITRRIGRFSWVNLVFPIPVIFFLSVFMLAIINLKKGEVKWKGRRLRTR